MPNPARAEGPPVVLTSCQPDVEELWEWDGAAPLRPALTGEEDRSEGVLGPIGTDETVPSTIRTATVATAIQTNELTRPAPRGEARDRLARSYLVMPPVSPKKNARFGLINRG